METNYGSVQRFICRDCGFRFSDNSYKDSLQSESSQLCAILEAKKLDTATEIKTVAGEEKSQQNMKGKILELSVHMTRQG